MTKHFKFKFTESKKNRERYRHRILKFDTKQLDGYSDTAKLWFVHCLVKQLEHANACDIVHHVDLYDFVASLKDEWVTTDLMTLYYQRMILDWCSWGVNCHVVTDWKTMLDLFEIAIDWNKKTYGKR